MSRPRYSLPIDAFTLSTSAKTAGLIIASSTVPITIIEMAFSVNVGTGRFLWELVESTAATAGTTTSTGAKQIGGYTAITDGTPNATYGRKYSAEPTALTRLCGTWVPCPGPLILQYPLGREPDSLLSGATNHKALGLRITVDTGTPTGDGHIIWEE